MLDLCFISTRRWATSCYDIIVYHKEEKLPSFSVTPLLTRSRTRDVKHRLHPGEGQHRTDLQLTIFIRYIYCKEWEERKTDKFYNIHFAELSCPSWCGAPVWEILMVTSYCVKPRWNVSSRSSLSQHLSPHSHWPEPGRTPQSASRRLTCQSLSHIYNIWTTWDGHQSPGNTANLGWYFPVDCHTVSGYDESSPEPWI